MSDPNRVSILLFGTSTIREIQQLEKEFERFPSSFLQSPSDSRMHDWLPHRF